MHRIDNATATGSLPTPAAVGPNPNSYFTRGNPGSATPATIVDDDWANAIQEEICYAIEQAGTTLDKTVRTQLKTAIDVFIQKNGAKYAASTTAANTYTATLSPAPTAYTTGMVVFIKFTNANTGAATINLNSLGAKSITDRSGNILGVGDIADGMLAVLGYDGTNFQLLNSSGGQSPFTDSTAILKGSVDATKLLRIECDGIATATTRVWTAPDQDLNLTPATQAEMETATATDRFVPPGRVQNHPGVAKAWVTFNGQGTLAVTESYNVSSVTDNGTGDYTVNFTTNFGSSGYALAGWCTDTDGLGDAIVAGTPTTTKTTSACQISICSAGPFRFDPLRACVIFFGDQ